MTGAVTRWIPTVFGVMIVGALIAGWFFLFERGGADSDDAASGSNRAAGPPAIPELFMQAYVNAADRVAERSPNCTGLRWAVLAGIGAVESGHARGATVSANGDVTPRIIGPRLDGSGVGGNLTPIPDTDGGLLDGDEEFDRAVGPMQFLPTTWERWSRDGNDDGVIDPHNIFDAALAAAAFLCGPGTADLAVRVQLTQAIRRYNRSDSYVSEVLSNADAYTVGRTPN